MSAIEKVREDSPIRGKVILITGASSGIGKSVALKLAEHQPKLVIFARTERKLLQTARALKKLGIKVLPIVGDIRNKEDRQKLVDFSLKAFSRIDILINNAGLGKANLFVEQPEEEIDELIETNFLSLVKLTQQVAQIMKEQGEGHIINMSTSLALLPVYPFAVYSATKAAIMTFGDSIRKEMDDYGIKVSTVYPGPYNTNFHQVANCGEGSFKVYDVSKLASRIVKAILKPKDDVIQPWFFVPLVWLSKRSTIIKRKVSAWIGDSILQAKIKTEREQMSKKEKIKKEKVQIIAQ